MANATSDIVAYRNQVFDFLGSMSIKFTPLCDTLNTNLMLAGYTVDQTDPTTWKYYVNLVGEYHASDTMMTVVSLDTQKTINFTKDNLAAHLRTASAYVPGTTYYDDLCTRYPGQVDLIKSIVYPAPDIQACIDADDFTILSYGHGFLEDDEEGPILGYLTHGITFITQRWFMEWLSYEPYYIWTFWGCLWQQLAMVVFHARIALIETPFVHSWHIWQYLMSNGLSNYSDVLTRAKSLFLYRNWRYLEANAGRQSTLVLLDEKLLSDIGVGIFGRFIYQQTETAADKCELTPDLIAIQIQTEISNVASELPVSTVSDMTARLYAVGDDVDTSTEYTDAMTRQIGDSTTNIMPTKILELRPTVRERKFAEFLNQFLMDTLVLMATNGMYSCNFSVVEPHTGTSIQLTPKTALALYYYCSWKACGYTPVFIPTNYSSTVAFTDKPYVIPDTIYRDGLPYKIAGLVDVAAYLDGSSYPLAVSVSPQEFSDTASTLFISALRQYRSCKAMVDITELQARVELTKACTINRTYQINLVDGVTDYTDWFGAGNTGLADSVFFNFDQSATAASLYGNLADLIMSALIPVTDTMILYGNFTLSASNYDKLRSLFVQMCSYNVTFLDSDQTVTQYLPLMQPLFYRKRWGIGMTLNVSSGTNVTLNKEGIYQLYAQRPSIAMSDLVMDASYEIDGDRANYALDKSALYSMRSATGIRRIDGVVRASQPVKLSCARGFAVTTG